MYWSHSCGGFNSPRLPWLTSFFFVHQPPTFLPFAGIYIVVFVLFFVHQPPGFLCWCCFSAVKPPSSDIGLLFFALTAPFPLLDVGCDVDRCRTWTRSRPACGWWRRASRRRHRWTRSAPRWASRCPSVSRSSRQVVQRAASFGNLSKQQYGCYIWVL